MFCPSCGKMIYEDSPAFCSNCGVKFPDNFMSGTSPTYGYAQNGDTVSDISSDSKDYNPKKYTYGPDIVSQFKYEPRPYTGTSYRSTAYKPSNNGPKVVAIIIALCLVAVAFVAAFPRDITIIDPEDTDPVKPKPDVNPGVVDTSFLDGMTVISYDAFKNGDMTYSKGTHEFGSDKQVKDCVTFKLNENIASNYTWYYWIMKDLDHNYYSAFVFDGSKYVEVANSGDHTISKFEKYNGYGPKVKAESALYWAGLGNTGEYTVTAYCCTSKPSDNNTSDGITPLSYDMKYSGRIVFDADVTKDYSWNYDGHDYKLKTTFKYSDYVKYRDNGDLKRKGDIPSLPKFVIVNPVVTDIGAKLKQLYLGTYGADADVTGQQFSDFILAFAQIAYFYPPYTGAIFGISLAEYPADKVVYGSSEYYAYPMETIFRGCGDCEDTAILAAAIYKACGYKTAIGTLPGHAIVGVVIDSYTAPSYDSSSYSVYSQTVNGNKYYGGETTVDSFLATGILLNNSLKDLDNTCTFYPVPA